MSKLKFIGDKQNKVVAFINDCKYYNNLFPIIKNDENAWTIESNYGWSGEWIIPKKEYHNEFIEVDNFKIEIDDILDII